jgi:hypothetical protein
MSVRAKFRVLQINQYFQSGTPTQGVELRPVMAKCSSYPDASEENAHFWDATPSGEAKITTVFGSDFLEGGACYYIEMEPDPEGDWELEYVNISKSQCDVKLAKEWTSHVQMNIGNKAAWAPFIEAGPGSKWKVDLVKAPPTGEHEPY